VGFNLTHFNVERALPIGKSNAKRMTHAKSLWANSSSEMSNIFADKSLAPATLRPTQTELRLFKCEQLIIDKHLYHYHLYHLLIR
jgi:hypothetical protein